MTINSPYLTSLLNQIDNGGKMYNYEVAKDLDTNLVVDDFKSPELPMMRDNPQYSQLAKLQEELANVRKQLKEYDVEAEMGKYKYLYDSDPSTYVSSMQNKRNAEATEKLRKATDEASKESTLQSAWKQHGVDLEVAKFDLDAAKNAFDEAEKNGDTAAMEKAKLEIKRAYAKYNRINRERDSLSNRMMKSLGVAERDDETMNEEFDTSGFDNRIAKSDAMKKIDGDISRLDGDIVVDNMPINKADKLAKIKDWKAKIAMARKAVDNSSLSTDGKSERKRKLDDLERKVQGFAKPSGKGGQTTKTTKDDYQAVLDSIGDNFSRLADKPYEWLVAAKKAGATHPQLERATKIAYGRKK